MVPLLLISAALFASPDTAIYPAQPRLGDPVEVYVVGFTHDGQPGFAEAFGYRFSLQPVSDQSMRAVVAIPSDIEPGDYPVKLSHPKAGHGLARRVDSRRRSRVRKRTSDGCEEVHQEEAERRAEGALAP